ncbi:ABC transporter family substrate-binding protein [Streptomyces sp. AK02-01A]|uniref:ABC transporter family substrate-binding protein n=1 Tax=Streptomyces sp. AK02-01A TaxID=3028648 RepID=UPI0029B217B8|nr:ABC transporter substrate-binding protein [Streptomyces sp. AK02-01A]MDX3852460.1 ABC transporter substrate-binding protein [Streptomyces sp. AK02-01A]
MSHVGAPRGRTCSRTLRSVALLTTGVLALPSLSACSSEDDGNKATAAPDIAPAGREWVGQGGTLHWAIDTMPATLNAFQADADASTNRIAGAVLPSLFTLDERGRPKINPDYLESAKVVEREPKQVVLYKLNQQAVWSDGREIGAPDFAAQWRALRGKDSAYWTARNAGYERIEKIERGASDLEVRVTFNKPYADWKSLFSPLYPKDVTAKPNSFNDGARTTLKKTAGPFTVKKVDRKKKEAVLVRNPRWWGEPAKLDSLVMRAVPRSKRAAALAAGQLDLAEVDRKVVERIALAKRDEGGGGQPLTHGPGTEITAASALRSWALANGSDEERAEAAQEAREQTVASIKRYAREQKSLDAYEVRKSLEPAYTQLALNGQSGPLADERVRRAVARAINRQELADTVLKPLGLPAKPLGSHLALDGQQAYADNSAALGKQDTQEAQALLTDAGWVPGGARKKADGAKAGSKGKKADAEEEAKKHEKKAPDRKAEEKAERQAAEKLKQEEKNNKEDNKPDVPSDEGTYIVGDEKPGEAAPRPETATHILAPAPAAAFQGTTLLRQAAVLDDSDVRTQTVKAAQEAQEKPGGMAGAYAPAGTAAPSGTATPPVLTGPVGKNGKPLTLRFVLPGGEGSESLRTVGERISRMLDRIGIDTEITKVADDNYFKDHVSSGDYDLALYSWPATAYPATDGRPIFAKPVPASDGSLLVEQNYTRVGTDHIDQLFDRAAGELDENAARDLLKQADARIWAAAGSIPLYQRPQLVVVKPGLMNAGAFGFATPRYQDIGFKKPGTAGPESKD